MTDTPKYPECTVELSGKDGNAFFILGTVRQELRRHLKSIGHNDVSGELDAFLEEVKSGDYDNLLQTCARWVNVE